MALRIDKLRFRNILVRGDMPEAPAIEFSDALDDTFREQLEGVATEEYVGTAIQQAVAEIKADAAEREARAAEREARITRQQQVLIGLVMGGVLTLIGFGIAILLAILL